MIKNIQKGFTLIELLIVIAVIAVLAGIVITAVNPGDTIDNAKDSKTQANLAKLPVAATIFYSSTDPFSFDGVCTSTDPVGLGFTLETTEENGLVCNDTADTWVAYGKLNVDSETTGNTIYYCVDSTGFSGERDVTTVTANAGDISCDLL